LNGALSNFEISGDRIGKLFEHLCLQLLISGYKGADKDIRISVYRTAAGAEVDFIIEHGKTTTACEVKATKKLSPDDFNGIKSFQNFFGKNCEKYLLYLGTDSYEEKDVHICSWEQGIKEILLG
jgi:predicted AAA+ superfamily ATPase